MSYTNRNIITIIKSSLTVMEKYSCMWVSLLFSCLLKSRLFQLTFKVGTYYGRMITLYNLRKKRKKNGGRVSKTPSPWTTGRKRKRKTICIAVCRLYSVGGSICTKGQYSKWCHLLASSIHISVLVTLATRVKFSPLTVWHGTNKIRLFSTTDSF